MRSRTRITTCGFMLAILIPLTWGCAGLSHIQQEVALKDLTHKAYKCERTAPQGVKYARHFERGWRQAYYNISKGADPCPPSLPPQQYWTVKYQNPDGCRKIAAWYEGYRKGVEAAQRDGRDLYNQVPISAQCIRESGAACAPRQELRTQPIFDQVQTAEVSDSSLAVTHDENVAPSSFYLPTITRLPLVQDEFITE